MFTFMFGVKKCKVAAYATVRGMVASYSLHI